MKKLTNFFLFLIPFCISAQSNTFRSNINNQFVDTSSYLSIGSRIFASSSFNSNEIFFSTYILGFSFDANVSDKLKLTSFYDYLYGDHYPEMKNYKDSLGIYPGFGINNNRFQFNAQYLANRFVSLDIGNGKQFIGDGYQSLLLSDIGYSYPYLKISTRFGSVKYYNLYTTFINPDMVDFGRKKHAAIHYLEFAVTKKIHFGIFESILWQSKSEEVNKGFEFAYLNPVIFYRPVEFSKHSSKGNALMGANFNMIFKSTVLYMQFLLDDLNISRQQDRDDDYKKGFFQNKYAYQIGLKGKIKDFKYLIEYNQVQPYTYGHRTILQNFSHMNQALAHPLGANFRELVNILELKKGKFIYKMKTMLTNVGLDSLSSHYGQNIFESDYLASTGGQYSYGNYNGQGEKTIILSFQPEVTLKLKFFDVFGSVYLRTKKSNLVDQSLIFYTIGLRTFPFLAFQDY